MILPAWLTQPTDQVRLNESHPLARDVVAAYLGSTRQLWGRVFRGVNASTADQYYSRHGYGTASSANLTGPTFGAEQFHPPCTLWAIMHLRVKISTAGQAIGFFVNNGGGDQIGFSLTQFTTFASMQRNSVGPNFTGSVYTPVSGKTYACFLRSVSDTEHILTTYELSSPTALQSDTSTTSTAAVSFQDFGAPRLGGISGTSWQNEALAGGLVDYCISVAEAQDMAVRPWALFEPRRIWFPVSAATFKPAWVRTQGRLIGGGM